MNFWNRVHRDLVSVPMNGILEDLDKGFRGKLLNNFSEVLRVLSDLKFVV